MTTYPAYRHGLTIEVRDGRYVVTNGFGGRVVVSLCDGLDDALDMRERQGFGFSAEAISFQEKVDAGKNRFHEAEQVVIALTGEKPSRSYDTHSPNLIRYCVDWNGEVSGESYDDEFHAHAIAMERLMDAVQRQVAQSIPVVRGAEFGVPAMEAAE